MLALYALLVTASTRDRLIGFSVCALCTIVPTALAKWPQVSMLSPDILILVLVLAVASISRSRRQALEHGAPSSRRSPPSSGWSLSATPPVTRPGWRPSSTTPWATP